MPKVFKRELITFILDYEKPASICNVYIREKDSNLLIRPRALKERKNCATSIMKKVER